MNKQTNTPNGNANKGQKAAATVYETAATSNKETLDAALKAGTEAAAKAFSMGKDRVELVAKQVDEFASFNKGNVEAFVQAGNVTAKAIEAINAELLAFSKSSLEDSLAAAKHLMSAKTLNELVELQSNFAKSALDSYLQETTKLGELSARVAQEVFEPLNARLQMAVEKMVKPIAA